MTSVFVFFFFFQAEDGIRDYKVTGVQTCALPILLRPIDDREEPGRVHAANVPGVQPAVGVERRRRGLGIVQVSLHDLRPTDEDLPVLAGPQVATVCDVDHPALRVRQRRGGPAAAGAPPPARGWARPAGAPP